jgi:hypothetical protein
VRSTNTQSILKRLLYKDEDVERGSNFFGYIIYLVCGLFQKGRGGGSCLSFLVFFVLVLSSSWFCQALVFALVLSSLVLSSLSYCSCFFLQLNEPIKMNIAGAPNTTSNYQYSDCCFSIVAFRTFLFLFSLYILSSAHVFSCDFLACLPVWNI